MHKLKYKVYKAKPSAATWADKLKLYRMYSAA